MSERSSRRKRGRKNQKEEPALAPDAPPLLMAEGPTDTVELKLTWEGGAAALATLSDNGDEVDFSHKQGVGKAGLNLKWRSPDALVHVLQWDLWFDGARTKLNAVATVNGMGGFRKAVGSDREEGRWSAAGTVRE